MRKCSGTGWLFEMCALRDKELVYCRFCCCTIYSVLLVYALLSWWRFIGTHQWLALESAWLCEFVGDVSYLWLFAAFFVCCGKRNEKLSSKTHIQTDRHNLAGAWSDRYTCAAKVTRCIWRLPKVISFPSLKSNIAVTMWNAIGIELSPNSRC